jgi:carnitine O-acetyltransferase
MTGITDFNLDKTGKIDLHAIYDQPDPRAYYQTLVNLDYKIPATAAPVFKQAIEAFRKANGRQAITLLDVGSSYGVNAAVLRHGVDLASLFYLYRREKTKDLSRSTLVERDRKVFSEIRADRSMKTIGLDVAGEAVSYAEEIGILDAGLAADLEKRPPSVQEESVLAPVDIVISTGAIGYVGAPTFTRILDCARTAPWLALFSLRMFPVDKIASALGTRGYSFYRLRDRTFPQRRFASEDESRKVLARLRELKIDPAGREAEGWYHADFYFAWRQAGPGRPPVEGLVAL